VKRGQVGVEGACNGDMAKGRGSCCKPGQHEGLVGKQSRGEKKNKN